MAKNGETIIIDRGYDNIRQSIEQTKSSFIEVGVFKAAEDATGGSVAEYAAANEFGTKDGRIPARPFMSSTFDEQKMNYQNLQNRLLGDVYTGKRTLQGAMIRLATRMTNDVRKKITALSEPRNAESTIAQKGVDNPLIDSGTLRNSIWFGINIVGTRTVQKQ